MKSRHSLTELASDALQGSKELVTIIHDLGDLVNKSVNVIDRQAKLLASKDLAAYQGIVAMDEMTKPPGQVEELTDDQIAYEEIKAEGREMTHDEKIYFDNAGFPVDFGDNG